METVFIAVCFSLIITLVICLAWKCAEESIGSIKAKWDAEQARRTMERLEREAQERHERRLAEGRYYR